MSKKMLIDARHPEETRVALLSGGKVEDFDFESLSRKPLRGNIYLARITRVEPSLQAAFVEYGGNRHGFLAFSEIHPDYYQIPVADRDVLRAAEALEAELAAKLSELDDETLDVKDDIESEDEASASTATESEDDEARTEDEDERPRRGRGRRRRGGRGRRGRGRNADETSSEEIEASDEAVADAVTEEAPNAETEASAEPEAENLETVASDDTGDAQSADTNPVEELSAQAEPEAEPEAEAEVEVQAEAETEVEADTNAEEPEIDPDADGPKSMPLSARTDPQLKEELPSNPSAEEETSSDDAETSAPESEVSSDIAAETDDVETVAEETASSEEETVSEETGDADEADRSEEESSSDEASAEETEARSEPEAPAEEEEPREPTEEELEARRRAKEISELQKRYDEARRERDRLLKNYRIQEVIKRRQIILIQVVKEERGNKGAALTTYLSLAGRYGVLMPNNSRGGGVSRKISNQSDRRRLRKAIADLNVPNGQGLIIRTAGAKRTKAEIKRDYDYLARLWDTIREQTLKSVAPCCIYEEASLIKRAIRDLYDKDTSEILVEGEDGYREAKDFMKMLMPSHAKHVQPYRETEPLFLRHSVEKQLDEMYQPVVNLKSGGYLVIQQTEALISVDVNSGKATKERNVEATALKTNSEAAVELARQCRLRDLAGLIVVDFIDMDENRNNRAVEKKFKDALKNDRARIQVGSISNFGLLEMSRQRRRSGIVDGTTRLCPTCDGSGFVRSVEMAALRVLRAVEEKAVSDRAAQVTTTTALDVALYILNQKRGWLNRIEASYGVTVEITGDHEKTGDQHDIQTSGKAPDLDTLRQSPAVEIGDVTVEPDTKSEKSDDASKETESRQDAEEARTTDDEDKPKKKRRRRRRRKSDQDEEDTARADNETGDEGATEEKADDAEAKTEGADDESEDEIKKKRRRGRRGGRGRKADKDTSATDPSSSEADEGASAATDAAATEEATPAVETAAPEAAPADETSATPVAASEEPVVDEKPAASSRTTTDMHAPLPDADTKKSKKASKRGGWWQRALGLDD